MSRVKVVMFCAVSFTVLVHFSGSSQSQDNICLGINCSSSNDFGLDQYSPGFNATEYEWEQFGELSGLLGGISAHREEKDYSSCLLHCVEHSDEAEDVCQNKSPYAGITRCKDVWKKTYESCVPHCQRLPH